MAGPSVVVPRLVDKRQCASHDPAGAGRCSAWGIAGGRRCMRARGRARVHPARDETELGSGTLPLSALGQRIAAFRISRGNQLTDDGYDVRTRPALAFGIERVRVTERIFTDYDYAY